VIAVHVFAALYARHFDVHFRAVANFRSGLKPSLTELHSIESGGKAIEWADTIIKLYDQDDLISNDHRSEPR
jgi:hypothetical protein